MLTFLSKVSGITQSIQNAKRIKTVLSNLMYSGTYNTCSFIISKVQLNSTHGSDFMFTSYSHLLVFFYRWTYVVIRPVNIHSLSAMPLHQMSCAQCHCLRVIKILHPIQTFEMYIIGSIDCACKSIYCVCCRNTSTNNRVVLYVVNSTMQNYTQLQ